MTQKPCVPLWKLAPLFLAVGFFPLQGQPEVPNPDLQVGLKVKKPVRSCVWKIEGDKGTVYLAGSVHLLREKDHPLPSTYQAAYDDADRVYFEVDMKEMNNPGAQMKMLTMSMLPGNEKIKDHLTEETYEKLQNYVRINPAIGPMADKLTPGMMAMTISSLEAMKIGARPDLGVEMVFDKQARRDQKPTVGLETVEFQINLFNGLNKEEQDNLLSSTLDQIEETPKELDNLIAAWKIGDIESLDAQLNAHFEDNEKLADILLFKRNAAWIPYIENELKETDGNAVFIVGAGHLAGKGSVNSMLKEKGYKLEQLTPDPAEDAKAAPPIQKPEKTL